jgi:hypothetical protein
MRCSAVPGQDADMRLVLVVNGLHMFDHLQVVGVRAVAEIESKYIYSRLNKF